MLSLTKLTTCEAPWCRCQRIGISQFLCQATGLHQRHCKGILGDLSFGWPPILLGIPLSNLRPITNCSPDVLFWILLTLRDRVRPRARWHSMTNVFWCCNLSQRWSFESKLWWWIGVLLISSHLKIIVVPRSHLHCIRNVNALKVSMLILMLCGQMGGSVWTHQLS